MARMGRCERGRRHHRDQRQRQAGDTRVHARAGAPDAAQLRVEPREAHQRADDVGGTDRGGPQREAPADGPGVCEAVHLGRGRNNGRGAAPQSVRGEHHAPVPAGIQDAGVPDVCGVCGGGDDGGATPPTGPGQNRRRPGSSPRVAVPQPRGQIQQSTAASELARAEADFRRAPRRRITNGCSVCADRRVR